MHFSEQEFAALQRSHLAVFAERCFMHLNPGVKYLHNWHLDLIADRLEKVSRGEIKRLIINVPPRSMKSIMASVALSAWLLGKDPTKSIISVSYSQELADKHAEDTRTIMQSAWYQALFPTRLSSKRPSAALLKTTKGGVRRATSVGGTLTGLGADIILIDDPLKPDDARRVARKSANDWFDNTLLSRLNDKQEGAIVIIMQRLHMDDLVGHVLQHGDWEVINLPAIAQEEEKFNYFTWREQATHIRKAGQVLQPKREPVEVLEMLRKQMGSYEFAGQYLQQPIPEDGGIVKLSWLHRYSPEQKPQKFDQIVHSWDTASKATELSDYSVCTVWGLANKRIYLIDVIRERLEFPNLKRKVIELYRRDNPKTILIEDQASGIQLIQELKEQSIYCVKAVKTQTDKVMRLKGQTARIENGEVLFPSEATWLDTYIAEMTVFPNGRNDDQVDSTSQALEWINTPTPNSGLLEFYRTEVEKLKNGGK